VHAAIGLTIQSALAVYALSLLCSLLLLITWQYWAARGTLSLRHVRPDVLGRCFRYGFHLFTTGLGGFGAQRINFFLLEWLSGSRAVGLFAAANSIPALFSNLPQQLATVLYSHVSRSGAEEGGRLTLAVVKVLAMTCVLLFIPVLIWRDELAKLLFGTEFAGIGVTMVVLSGAMALAGLTGVIVNALAGIGQPKYGSYMTYLSLTLIATLGAWLTAWRGLEGAALAQFVAAAIVLVCMATVFCRKAGIRGSALFSISAADVRLLFAAERRGQAGP
jgi:O-antigen/teichoic acid export membrane protein